MKCKRLDGALKIKLQSIPFKISLQTPGGHVDRPLLLLVKFSPQLLSKLFEVFLGGFAARVAALTAYFFRNHSKQLVWRLHAHTYKSLKK